MLNESILRAFHVSESSLRDVTMAAQAEAVRRERSLRSGLSAISPARRVIVLVDDGLATGATMRLCIGALRKHAPERLVVAVPVGAPDACEAMRLLADEVVCPWQVEPFFSVGSHYQDFDQVSDREVELLLHEQRARRSGRSSSTGREVY